MDKTQKLSLERVIFASHGPFQRETVTYRWFSDDSVISRGTIWSLLNSKGRMDGLKPHHGNVTSVTKELQRIKRKRRKRAALLWRSSDNKREIALLLLHPLWQNTEKIKLIWKGVKIYSKRRERDQRGRCKNVIISLHNHSSRMTAYLCNCWETLPMFHYPSELLTAQGLCIDTAFKSFILMLIWKL